MKLKNMQDIGGCRAIVTTLKKLDQIVRELKKRPEFKTKEGRIRFKDYIKNPKEDGYRGYHLIGRFGLKKDEQRSIEIQIRTILQHDWATALEIVDLFTGQALKSNQGKKEWQIFFKGVSEQFAIMEEIRFFNTLNLNSQKNAYLKKVFETSNNIDSCINTQKYSKLLDVEKKFEAFAQSLKIVDEKFGKDLLDGYVLIEVDSTLCTVKSRFFSKENNSEAKDLYIETEKLVADKSSVVVALVSTTAIGGIKEAYPNYFADSTDFLKHLMIITTASVSKNKSFFSNFFK